MRINRNDNGGMENRAPQAQQPAPAAPRAKQPVRDAVPEPAKQPTENANKKSGAKKIAPNVGFRWAVWSC